MIKENKVKDIDIYQNKNFMILFIGSIISQFGSVFINFATTLFILDLTGNAFHMSMYFAVTTVVGLISQPVFGALSDRFDKVKLISRLDFILGITDLSLALLLFLTSNTTFIFIGLYLNGIINSALFAMYTPTFDSLIPAIVKDEELTKAYSLMSIVGNSEQIVGLLLASIVYMFVGFKYILIFNSITFLITAFIERFIKVEYIPTKTSSLNIKHLLNEIKEGYDYMTEKRELINMAKVAVLMNIFLVGIMSISLPYIINTDLGLPPYILSSLTIGLSLGGLIMAMLVSKWKVEKAGKMIIKGFVYQIVVFVVLTFSYAVLLGGVISTSAFISLNLLNFFGLGCIGSYIQVPLNTSYAKRVESEYRGRVMALRSTLSRLATPLAMLIFGGLLEKVNVLPTLALGCIGIIFATIYTFKNKYIRAL